MIVQLTDVSQGVSIDGKSTPVNRLHFQMESGKTFSIKVPTESLEELLQAVFGEQAEPKTAAAEEPPPVQEEEEDLSAATSFGGDDEETGEDVGEEEREFRRAPPSEDEVPSL